MTRLLSLLFFVLVFVSSSSAFADEASIAFNEGKRLFGKGKFAASCAQFAKAEAAAGQNVKTRYWTGRCSEEQDKKAAAFLAYRDAKRMAVKAGDTKRAKVIDQRIAELGQILPFLVLTVPPAMQGVDGLTVTRNGEDVPQTLWDQPLPVDMGKHEIVVSAPGYKAVTLKVTASEPGSKAQLVVPTLQKVDAGSPAPNPDGTAPPPPPPPAGGDQGPVEMERKNGALFGTGIGLVSAGGLAVLVGAVALVVGSLEETADDFASGPSCDDEPDNIFCEEDGADEGSPATRLGAGLLITGVVFLGVGIPFIVVFGKKVPAEPEPGEEQGFTIEPVITPGGFKLRGTF